jgi:hypothetical protein
LQTRCARTRPFGSADRHLTRQHPTADTRSRHVAVSLEQLGFKDIALMEIGGHAWLLARLPLTR